MTHRTNHEEKEGDAETKYEISKINKLRLIRTLTMKLVETNQKINDKIKD